MINVRDFLKRNINRDTYALVTYNGRTEAVLFLGFYYKNKLYFLETPCKLHRDQIYNFFNPPFLPEEVDDIKIISEQECLEWLINNYTE